MANFARTRRVGVAVCASATILSVTAAAGAYSAKHTASGLPVHWTSQQVSFVIDSSVNTAASNAADAITSAAHAWSGSSGAPTLSTSSGHGASGPAVDGQNTILFAKGGFAAAGNALAITLVSYDAKSGDIVDTDVVINGKHPFAVLSADARAAKGTQPVSTEGGSSESDDDKDKDSGSFDLQHVVTHELGHALGLGDVADQTSDIMYAYTMPGDASVRAPTTDDLAGITVLYDEASSSSPSSSSGGCGANITGRHATTSQSWIGLGLVVGAIAWGGRRRRGRGFLTAGIAVVVLASSGRPLSAATATSTMLPTDATAHVVAVTTQNNNGVFESTLELEPRICRIGTCPSHAKAHLWGGTLNGITQEVGNMPVPNVDDEVDVILDSTVAADLAQASVVAVRPLSAGRALPYR